MVDKKEFINAGYWAVILGGSSGMGLAAAHKLARHGMNICIVHRDRKKDLPRFEKEIHIILKNGVHVIHYNLDAIKSENQQLILGELIKSLNENGKIRLLLHAIAKGNLGSIYMESSSTSKVKSKKPYSPLNKESLLLTSEAMALCLLTWVQEIHTHDLFATDARVLSISSEGSDKTWSGYGAVGIAKAALISLSKYIATEYAHTGLKCNVIQAGVTDTPSLRMIPDAENLKKLSKARNPMGRLTTVDDIANVIYLLCLDEAAWINGAVIPVDGGEKNC